MPRKLSNREKIIAWRLTEGRPVGVDEIVNALHGNEEDGGPLCALQNARWHVHWVRVFARSHGLDVINYFGVGWQISDPELLREILAREIEREANVGTTKRPRADKAAYRARGARESRDTTGSIAAV